MKNNETSDMVKLFYILVLYKENREFRQSKVEV
jgi:hypothetical protein